MSARVSLPTTACLLALLTLTGMWTASTPAFAQGALQDPRAPADRVTRGDGGGSHDNDRATRGSFRLALTASFVPSWTTRIMGGATLVGENKLSTPIGGMLDLRALFEVSDTSVLGAFATYGIGASGLTGPRTSIHHLDLGITTAHTIATPGGNPVMLGVDLGARLASFAGEASVGGVAGLRLEQWFPIFDAWAVRFTAGLVYSAGMFRPLNARYESIQLYIGLGFAWWPPSRQDDA